jgi:antirestriction protein ArdC
MQPSSDEMRIGSKRASGADERAPEAAAYDSPEPVAVDAAQPSAFDEANAEYVVEDERSLVEAAERARLIGDFSRAAELYAEAAKAAPLRTDYLMMHGHCSKDAGDHAAAMEAYRQAGARAVERCGDATRPFIQDFWQSCRREARVSSGGARRAIRRFGIGVV